MTWARHQAVAAGSLWCGLGVAAVGWGMVLSVATIIGRGPTSAVDGVATELLHLAIVSLVTIVGCVAGSWWIGRAEASAASDERIVERRAETVSTVAMAVAVVGVVALTVATVRIGSRRDVIVLVDENAATVTAVLGACCALVALVCLSAVARRVSDRHVAVTDRRSVLVAAAATSAVIVAVTCVVGVSDRSQVVRGPALATSVDVPEFGDRLTTVGFRWRLSSDESTFVGAAGPGFLMKDGARVSSHDGASGTVRWIFDATRTTGPKSDDVDVSTFATPDGDVVVVHGAKLAVGLDAMTGRLLWRSTDTTRALGPDGVILRNPRTGGRSRTVDLPCDPVTAQSERYALWMSCDAPGSLVVADWATGAERSVAIPGATDERIAEIKAFDGDVIAVRFDWRIVDSRLLPVRYVFVDVARGIVVGEVSTLGVVLTISDTGVIARTGDDGELLFQDTRSARTVRVDDSWVRGRVSYAWVGTQFAIGAGAGEIHLVDPVTRAHHVRAGLCIPGVLEAGDVESIRSVPGAVLIGCTARNMPFDTEMVSLR